MKKTSSSSNNRLSYLETYDDINIHNNNITNINKKKTSILSAKSKQALEDYDEEEIDNIKLSKASRYFIYILFSFINIVINMDSGNIPAATNKISDDLKIDDKSLGAFGSLVSVGTFLGGIISFSIINTISRKYTLIVANIGIIACLFTFPISSNLILLYGNRIIVGIFQVSFNLISIIKLKKSYIQVFFPVWVDQFGPKKGRPLMISLLQVAVPLGIVLGYLMTALFVQFDYSVSK